MDSAIISRISRETGVPDTDISAAVAFFEGGATVPFVTHYRREAVGGLDGNKFRAIYERHLYYSDLVSRREALLKTAAAQGKLTDDFKMVVNSAWSRAELEDAGLHLKQRKRSRAAEAMGKGLESLADYLWNQEEDAWGLDEHINVCVDAEKHLENRDQVIQGAIDIIAERIADSLEFRKALRERLWAEGAVASTVVPAKADQKTKYNMYYNRREPAATIPSHRVLAIRRGTKEGVLTSAIEGDHAKAVEYLLNAVIRDRTSPFAPFLDRATRDSYHRILRPLIETEVRAQLKERADRDAIRIFQDNLASLLMSPPAGPLVVMGLDPGKGNDCRVAVVDATGKLQEETGLGILPPPEAELENVRAKLKELVARYSVQALAFGSSPSGRELEFAVRALLSDEECQGFIVASVNDAGVAIYSASRIAREEFADLTAAGRCAVSLARRLQDPMAELVKIDPKLIGVGQYQHDVDQKELHRSLIQVVQSCVNRVGVDANTAGHSLLRYVSGLDDRLARRIVAVRDSKGPYPSREALRSVCALEDATWQQAAGFLRIRGGENPLDATAVHPESYPVVERMAAAVGVSIADLVSNRELVESLPLENLANESCSLASLQGIRRLLLDGGRDPRGKFTLVKPRNDVRAIEDLKDGMELEGVVTNVTNFGAFVDVGVQQDGLVHLSQMSNRFIRDPREAVKVGDTVRVKIISVEVETKRIGLSIKALLPPPQKRRRKPPVERRGPRPQPKADASAGESTAVPEGTQPEQRQRRPQPRRQGPPRDRRPGGAHARGRGPRRREAPRAAEPVRQPATVAADPTQPAVPEPEVSERSLQEKIAILQTKFRGLG